MLPPPPPIPRTTAVMGHSDDAHMILYNPVDHGVGKILQDAYSCGVASGFAHNRVLCKQAQCAVYFVGEIVSGCKRLLFKIPVYRRINVTPSFMAQVNPHWQLSPLRC